MASQYLHIKLLSLSQGIIVEKEESVIHSSTTEDGCDDKDENDDPVIILIHTFNSIHPHYKAKPVHPSACKPAIAAAS